MSAARKGLEKLSRGRLPFVQVTLVTLAFGIMVISSYLFGIALERRHLRNETEKSFHNTEVQLAADLRELETLLGVVSETVREMIVSGEDYEDIKEYITDMTVYAGMTEEITGFLSFFGMFQVFGDRGYNGLGWEGEPGYVPEDRPWYKLASTLHGGETGFTEPYVDAVTGEVSFSYARNIYDDDGVRIAIICMDVSLDRIYAFSLQSRAGEDGYWILLDKNHNITAHPEIGFLGLPLRDIDCGAATFAEELARNNHVAERRIKDYKGEPKNIEFRQIGNGWYMGVLTPAEYYYDGLRQMLWVLVALGGILSVLLSVVLVRITFSLNKAEEKTRREVEEAKNLRMILDFMPIGVRIWRKDDGALVYANQASLEVFGCTSFEEDVAGKSGLEFMPEIQPDGRLSADIVAESFKADRYVGEMQCFKLSGEPFLARIASKNVEYEGSLCSLGIIEDMSAEQEYRLKLEETAHKEQEANQLKSRFLATISHEIRTPMNTILGTAEIQLQNKALSAEVEDAFVQICDSGDLLLNIINDILDFSKIEAGKMELTSVKYDIPSLVNDAAQINMMRFEEKPVKFVVNVDENTPFEMIGDEFRIRQILNNLLSNAYKYTDEGRIEFSVRAEPVAGSREDVVLVLRVRDTGRGMTKEQLSRLFDEFTRFNDKKRTVIGTGLGMSITKRLVEMMNGEITVESDLGAGSVFTVRLPQKLAGTAVCGAELAQKLRTFKFKSVSRVKKTQIIREYMPYGNVLIVDDVETNLQVAKGMMAPYGLKIDTACGGTKAVEKIKNGAVYDIIFMDHMMPDLDGMEATKMIRRLGYENAVVALTANAVSGQEERFLKNGFNGFLSKPIDSRELNSILNTHIRDKKPPEVVKAAKRENAEKGGKNFDEQLEMDLAQVFKKDAEKTAAVINAAAKRIAEKNMSKAEWDSFVTAIHGIKGALAGIGETTLSDEAAKLERAAKDREGALITEEAPAFLESLRMAAERKR